MGCRCPGCERTSCTSHTRSSEGCVVHGTSKTTGAAGHLDALRDFKTVSTDDIYASMGLDQNRVAIPHDVGDISASVLQDFLAQTRGPVETPTPMPWGSGVPTAEQLADYMAVCSARERLVLAQRSLDLGRRAGACMQMDHEAAVYDLNRARQELADVRRDLTKLRNDRSSQYQAGWKDALRVEMLGADPKVIDPWVNDEINHKPPPAPF